MKNYILFSSLLLAAFQTVFSAQKSQTYSLRLPAIKIHNNSKQQATLTGITVSYKEQEKPIKILETTKIPLPANTAKIIDLQLSDLPIEHSKNIEFLGISEIEVNNKPILFTTLITGIHTIYINYNNNSWILDKKNITTRKDRKQIKKESKQKPMAQ